MAQLGFEPLASGADLPDGFQVYSGGFKSGRRITEMLIHEKVIARQIYSVPLGHRKAKLRSVRRSNVSVTQANELLRQLNETLSLEPTHELARKSKSKIVTICSDGPEYYAIVRIGGNVRGGNLEWCDYPRTTKLICEIENTGLC